MNNEIENTRTVTSTRRSRSRKAIGGRSGSASCTGRYATLAPASLNTTDNKQYMRQSVEYKAEKTTFSDKNGNGWMVRTATDTPALNENQIVNIESNEEEFDQHRTADYEQIMLKGGINMMEER